MVKKVKKRNLFLFIFLGVITVGIYWIVAFCIMGNEINDICDGDDKHTMFYLWAWLLGLITFGIFPLIWFYKAMERLKDNGYRYQINVKHSGGEFILWFLLGSFIVVGPIVAFCYFAADINQFSEYVGLVNPCPYTENPVERLDYKKTWNFIPDYSNPQPDIDNGCIQVEEKETDVFTEGNVMCISGDFQGYSFPVKDNKELIIGKDPAVCNVVIDAKYKTISRKHVGIRFDKQHQIYQVVDYSTNGTFVTNGEKLQTNQISYLKKGTVINLGNSDCSFRLG